MVVFVVIGVVVVIVLEIVGSVGSVGNFVYFVCPVILEYSVILGCSVIPVYSGSPVQSYPSL